MKKIFNKYSIGIGVGMILGIAISNISNVFGASGPQNPGTSTQESILNEACIEYTTPSGTGIKCDDVRVYYSSGGGTQEHEYFLQKWQKTGNMTNFTTGQVTVELGDYIQYKVVFGSITGDCRNGMIKDILPSCVNYVSSQIYDVSGSPIFSTGNGYLQYSNFRLNGGTQGYIIVTGQVTTNGRDCESKTRYVNTGAFKCNSPVSEWMYSSVVAIRTGGGGGGGSGSEVLFTKTGNKYEMHPGETGLTFTLKVENKGPNPITGIVIDDIRPNINDCIIFVGWNGSNRQQSGQDYTWLYVGNHGVLRSGRYSTLELYAKIKDDPNCVGSYINTGKLTYQEGGKSHVLYDDYSFIVVDAGAGYDVSIKKSVNKTQVHHGETITYTIEYTNIGTNPLTNYTITDEWPNDKLEFISSDPNATTNNGNIITWFFTGPLRPGKSGRITINAKVR